MHLVNGMGNSPSPRQLTPGVVKQDKSSRGSVDTLKQNQNTFGPTGGQNGGERPIGAANGKQPNTAALCPPPPPPLTPDHAPPPDPSCPQMRPSGAHSASSAGQTHMEHGINATTKHMFQT